MVRDINTIYAEANDPDTVLTKDAITVLKDGGLVLGNGGKTVRDLEDLNAIVYVDNGVAQVLPIQPNKRLGTDANGNLAWV